MPAQDYKLRAAALALGRFTAQDLAKASGAPLETARSWVKRHSALPSPALVRAPAPDTANREPGRPRGLWSLSEHAEKAIRSEIGRMFAADVRGRNDGIPALEAAEDAVRRLGNPNPSLNSDPAGFRGHDRDMDPEVARSLRFAAQAQHRIALEQLHDLLSAEAPVGEDVLTRLAKLEGGLYGADLSIPPHVGKALKVLEGIIAANAGRWINPAIAARMLLGRLKARPTVERAFAVAASLAGVARLDDSVHADSFIRHTLLALQSLLPVAEHADLAARAIDRTEGQYEPGEELEAILYGMASIQRLANNSLVCKAVAGLSYTTHWRDELAPVALQIMSKSGDINLMKAAERMQEELMSAIELWTRQVAQMEEWRRRSGERYIRFAQAVLDRFARESYFL